LKSFDFQIRTRVVFGDGSLERLGELARELAFTRTLIVADPGIARTTLVDRAAAQLEAAGIAAFRFHDFDANPDTRMVDRGRTHAAACAIDSLVALGGGSSLDCAKGINFVLTNGGTMADYQGFGKASRAMLPSIGVPTTAGTGSEAQSSSHADHLAAEIRRRHGRVRRTVPCRRVVRHDAGHARLGHVRA
jgi:alcohol dehydrogenase